MCHKGALAFFFCSFLVGSACNKETRSHTENQVLIFAAVSAAQAVEEATRHSSNIHVIINAASSSILARQIDNGATADIFVSADSAWMEWLQKRQRLQAGTIKPLLTNSLAAVSSSTRATWPPKKNTSLKIAIADPEHVPLGRYTKKALSHEDLWQELKEHYVYGKDAHSTLRFLERDEVDMSIVYTSDAKTSNARIIHEFATNTTPPIIYPVALSSSSRKPNARKIYDLLLRSQATFQKHGFEIP